MSRALIEVVIGLVAFGVTLFTGYRSWHARQRLIERVPVDRDHPTLRGNATGAMPIASGICAGLLLLGVFAREIVPGDRFYDVQSAMRTAIAMVFAGLLVLIGELTIWTLVLSRSIGDRERMLASAAKLERRRWLLMLVMQCIGALIVIAAGVRFKVLGVGHGSAIALGWWSIPLTLVWLLAATNIVRLLDGLQGAANALLLMAAAAILFSATSNREHFLAAVSVAIIGATLASLRFNVHPARLPVGGAGTAFIGFMFALLTVLARQKTLALFLLVLPLGLVVLIIGGYMLTFLERSISTGERR